MNSFPWIPSKHFYIFKDLFPSRRNAIQGVARSATLNLVHRYWAKKFVRIVSVRGWKVMVLGAVGSRKKICPLAQKQREFRFLRWPSPQNHSASFPWPVNPETYYRISYRFAAARQAYFACTIFPAGHPQTIRCFNVVYNASRLRPIHRFERFPANFPSNV